MGADWIATKIMGYEPGLDGYALRDRATGALLAVTGDFREAKTLAAREGAAFKLVETALPDAQCGQCRCFMKQWTGIPAGPICGHCQRDPGWQHKIDYTKPLFLCV